MRKVKELWEETKTKMNFLDAEGELVLVESFSPNVDVSPNVGNEQVAEVAAVAVAAADVDVPSDASSVIGQ